MHAFVIIVWHLVKFEKIREIQTDKLSWKKQPRSYISGSNKTLPKANIIHYIYTLGRLICHRFDLHETNLTELGQHKVNSLDEFLWLHGGYDAQTWHLWQQQCSSGLHTTTVCRFHSHIESCPLTKLNGGGWRRRLVADQLWFMTHIREEEE